MRREHDHNIVADLVGKLEKLFFDVLREGFDQAWVGGPAVDCCPFHLGRGLRCLVVTVDVVQAAAGC